MSLVRTIFLLSFIVWLFPIFRQYKTKVFYFFLILGLMDPFSLLLSWHFKLFQSGIIFSIGSLLMFFSIEYSIQSFLKYWVLNSFLIIICISAIIFLPNLEIFASIMYLLILFKFIRIVLFKLYKQGEFNIFYLVLIFYNLSLIFNTLLLLNATEPNIIVFVSTALFQLLIAIFFTIFREDSKRLAFQVKVAK